MIDCIRLPHTLSVGMRGRERGVKSERDAVICKPRPTKLFSSYTIGAYTRLILRNRFSRGQIASHLSSAICYLSSISSASRGDQQFSFSRPFLYNKNYFVLPNSLDTCAILSRYPSRSLNVGRCSVFKKN